MSKKTIKDNSQKHSQKHSQKYNKINKNNNHSRIFNTTQIPNKKQTKKLLIL